MPDILSYTPEWLTRPSPGFDFFSSKATTSTGSNKRLANRGTEIFYAVGNELRWADLNLLEASLNESTGQGWRSLKTPVAHAVEQLSISPDGNLLAVVTKHTCHICILPAPSHLRSGDESTLKLRSFQLGPTAHVLEQAPIVSVLWHPLSIPGLQTLVTITLDACVRMFEVDVNNRYSLDQPSLAFDLVKLANATSSASDFSASRFGTNRGFSPDDVEMEVAAACFGGQGLDDEYGWASMTLWIAMIEGEVYALCPLLPSRFRLPESTLPSLSTAVVAEAQLLAADQHATDVERQRAQQQTAWLTALDEQDAILVQGQHEFDLVEVYTRPEKPGIAKLQGPFQLSADINISAVTDIVAIAPVADDAALGEEDEDDQHRGLSLAILCLGTESAVHVCLNLEGLQAEWLPAKRSRAFTADVEAAPADLLLFETIALPGKVHFTLSPLQRYELLVTHSAGVHAIDLWHWVTRLEDELDGAEGAVFRLKLVLEDSSTVTPIIKAAESQPTVAFLDASLGYFVLTATPSGPHAATIAMPVSVSPYAPDQYAALPAPEPRQSYQSAAVFFEEGEIAKFAAGKRAQPVSKAVLAKTVQSTPETLHMLTDAHRILSQETNRLGLAAAELFRQCKRMCDELADQVQAVDNLSQTVTGLTEVDGEDDEDCTVEARIDQRIMKITSDADNVNERLENIRRKMLRLGGHELSRKEKAFVGEVGSIQGSIEEVLAQRLAAATGVSEELLADVSKLSEHEAEEQPEGKGTTNEYKKQKLERVMQLLARESALMEAVTSRLERLGGI